MSPSSTDRHAPSQQGSTGPEAGRAADLEDGYELLDEPEGGFEVVEETDPLGKVRVRLRTDRAQHLRCVYCHETLVRSEVEKCPACDAYVHRECAALLNGCSTLGCTGRAAERGQAPSTTTPETTPLLAAGAWASDLLAAAAFAVVFGVIAAVAADLARVLVGLDQALGPLTARLSRDIVGGLVGLLVFALRLRAQRRRRARP